MVRRSGNRKAIVTIVAVIAALVLAYWGYGSIRKYSTQRTTLSLLADSSLRLREALNIEAGPPPADAMATIRKLEEHAEDVDAHLQKLRGMDAFLNLTLFDDSDSYVLSVRELLRKQASIHRQRVLLAASQQALLDHRLRGNRRSPTWITEAVRAKDRFEKDYRDYRNADDAFELQLKLLPASQKRIAPHVAPAVLIEESVIAEARKQALESSQRTADEAGKTRKLASLR